MNENNTIDESMNENRKMSISTDYVSLFWAPSIINNMNQVNRFKLYILLYLIITIICIINKG